MQKNQPSAGEQGALSSSKFDGADVLSLARWSHWEQGFAACSEKDVSEDAKVQAARAAQSMASVVDSTHLGGGSSIGSADGESEG